MHFAATPCVLPFDSRLIPAYSFHKGTLAVDDKTQDAGPRLISLTLVCAVGSGCRSEGPAHNLAKTSYQKPKTQRNGVPAAAAPLRWEDAASTLRSLRRLRLS